MSWVPAVVLFGSSVFPLGYMLSGEDRNVVGKTGVVMVLTPILGLILGVALAVGSLDSLLSSPIRLGATALGIVEVFVIVGFLIPRVIGNTAGEVAVETVAERVDSSTQSSIEPDTETQSEESTRDDAIADKNTDAAETTTEQSAESAESSVGSWRYVLLGLVLVFVLNPAVVAVFGSPIAGAVLLTLGIIAGLFGLYRVVF